MICRWFDLILPSWNTRTLKALKLWNKGVPSSHLILLLNSLTKFQRKWFALARPFTNASFLWSRCERCDKKVDTVKRLCVKKLPPILVIQLKRFDYDYERMCLIKFNDFFEFPRELDMEPYTVGGLAKIEGEAVDCDPSDLDDSQVRKYRLRGIVVHR